MDMGPRRSMDMGRRPSRTVEPLNPEPVAPAPRVARRPVAPAPRAAAVEQPIAQPQVARPSAPLSRTQAASQPSAEVATPRTEPRGGGWRTAVQVIIGLMVIASVASAIVVLYIRYYRS